VKSPSHDLIEILFGRCEERHSQESVQLFTQLSRIDFASHIGTEQNLLKLQFYSLITDNFGGRFPNVENVLGSICHSRLLTEKDIHFKTEKD